MQFVQKPNATVKLRRADGDTTVNVAGVTAADTLTPEVAATQANKLWNIAGVSLIAVEGVTTRALTEVAVNE